MIDTSESRVDGASEARARLAAAMQLLDYAGEQRHSGAYAVTLRLSATALARDAVDWLEGTF